MNITLQIHAHRDIEAGEELTLYPGEFYVRNGCLILVANVWPLPKTDLTPAPAATAPIADPVPV